MKNFIFRICLGAITVFFVSCTKSLNAGHVLSANSIVGEWELKKVTGGFRGIYPEKNYPPGNGNTWTFSDSKYQTYSNSISIQGGNYLLGKDSSRATGRVTDFIMLSSNEKIYFEIENNILTLYRGELMYDGTIEKYDRLIN